MLAEGKNGYDKTPVPSKKEKKKFDAWKKRIEKIRRQLETPPKLGTGSFAPWPECSRLRMKFLDDSGHFLFDIIYGKSLFGFF